MTDCCALPSQESLQDQSICPTCDQRGKPVHEETIRSLTSPDHPDFSLIAKGYYCTTPDDPTVYFIPEKNMIIDKNDLIVRVGIKETQEPIYVCYCFRYTKEEIESDFFKNGQSTIEEEIRQKVRDNLCSCEVTNPSGRCCLSDVRKTYLEVEKETMSS